MMVNPKETKEFTIYIRVPNRTTSALYTPTPQVNGLQSLTINGKPVSPKIENGYAVIRRVWKKGDKIEVVIPMKIQKISADERIEADSGKLALRYGPLIYNVELADQHDIDQAIGTAPLSLEWRPDFLHGVMTINGKWADGSPLVAIPNYSRLNRAPIAPLPQSNRANPQSKPVSIVWIKTN
jgi:DUF1680 family protein